MPNAISAPYRTSGVVRSSSNTLRRYFVPYSRSPASPRPGRM
jgi:hypothetical protein